jgi:SPP1 gp7 family putative phage head morphogenesis protein
MLRYSIAELGRARGRSKGTTATLPAIEGRVATEREYYAAIRRMLNGLSSEVRNGIIPAYKAERDQVRVQSSMRLDADRSWFNRIKALAVELARVATEATNEILNLEAKRHTDTFMAQAKRTLGIDLSVVVRQEDLDEYLRTVTARNASYITSLANDTVKAIEQTVYRNSIDGNSVATLRKELQKQFGLSNNRAKLISRDQSSKFNGELNKIRQEQAGISEYTFSTSHDERVRSNHKVMSGRICKWSDPSVYKSSNEKWVSRSGIGGVALHPGQDIQCRCVGTGVIKF